MKISSIYVSISFLVGLAFASQTPQNSVTKLVRRGEKKHPPFSNTYIMINKPRHTHSSSIIYYPNGATAYSFDKHFNDFYGGKSFTVVTDSRSQPVLWLASKDDICSKESHFVEPNVPGSHNRVFQFVPRRLKPDEWTFSFISSRGEVLSYRLKKNLWNKEGKLYETRKGEDEVQMCLIENQTRWEPWLHPGSKGADVFALSCAASAPQVEAVTLLAMILAREDACKS